MSTRMYNIITYYSDPYWRGFFFFFNAFINRFILYTGRSTKRVTKTLVKSQKVLTFFFFLTIFRNDQRTPYYMYTIRYVTDQFWHPYFRGWNPHPANFRCSNSTLYKIHFVMWCSNRTRRNDGNISSFISTKISSMEWIGFLFFKSVNITTSVLRHDHHPVCHI